MTAPIQDYVPPAPPPSRTGRPGRPRLPRPVCALPGCGKPVNRARAVYCSFEHRNAAMRAHLVPRPRREIRTEDPLVREAFRRAYYHEPAATWPPEVLEAYRRYVRERRAARRRAAENLTPDH